MPKNVFKEAVENTSDLVYKVGKGAISEGKDKIIVTKDCTGSVNIDDCLKQKFHNDSRWDYAIGIGDKAFFVEVHPACSGGNMQEMINKAKWLVSWLHTSAPELKAIQDRNYYWVASGRIDLRDTNKKRQLVSLNVKGPTTTFVK